VGRFPVVKARGQLAAESMVKIDITQTTDKQTIREFLHGRERIEQNKNQEGKERRK
jgi:hypothetical protein